MEKNIQVDMQQLQVQWKVFSLHPKGYYYQR